MAPGSRSAYHDRPGAGSRRPRRAFAMPSTPHPTTDPTRMDEPHRRALLDFAVSQTSTVFYIADIGTGRRTRFISDNVEWLTGHPASAFTDQPGYGTALLHPDDRPAYFEAINRVHEAGELTIEYRFRRKDGAWAWIRDTLRVVDTDGTGAMAVVGCMLDVTAEREAVARVDTAEAVTRALLNSAMDAILATDGDGLVVEFNPAAERMFGYPRAAALGRPLADLIIPPDYRERHAAGMRRFRESGDLILGNRRMEVEAMRADGSTFPAELTISATDAGPSQLVIGEVRDISERMAALNERRRLIQLMTDAIESLPDGFVVSDSEDRILFCNSAFARSYDRPPHAMVGLTPDDVAPAFFRHLRRFDGRLVEGDRTLVPWVAQRLREVGGKPIELELIDGSWREISRHRTSDGGSVTLRADITDRKRAELALRDSEAMIRRILEAAPVTVGMTRAEDGLILYESPASRRLFLRDPIVGDLSARSFFVEPAERERYVETLYREGGVDAFEATFRRTDGSQFSAAVSARLIDYQGEKVVVSSVFDLTERRRVEAEMARQREALHQSEKLSALGELLAGVSHELNNPLSVVVGQALLMRETATDAKTAERARKIGEAADRCARIVRTFLAMARQQPTETRPVDVNATIEAALEVTGYMLRTADIDISLELTPLVPPILADPDQINQVVTNLIVNAQHALAGAARPHRLRLMTSHDRRTDRVILKVSDNGNGVPEAVASRIFEPFFTTKEVGHGTGLGLAITHRIVEAHGGSIALEETPGGGATFVLQFPAHSMPARRRTDGAATAFGPALSVLVVDDEPEVAEIVSDVLTEAGHRVAIATSGRAAMEKLVYRRYDVVLSDVRMPDLDGPALYDLLEDRYPELRDRVAFITGDTMSTAIRRFLDRCGRPYLEKPVVPADLRRLVAQLGGRGADREGNV